MADKFYRPAPSGSSAAGAIAALAVLAHDLLDGANTVTLSLVGGARKREARLWLVADAAAPVYGILAARAVTVPPNLLAFILAFFAGSFLYVEASELLPRSRDRARGVTRAVTVGLELGFICAVVRLAALWVSVIPKRQESG